MSGDIRSSMNLSIEIKKMEFDEEINGKALMQAGLGELDYQTVAVWVLKDNKRAIKFYEKCGFCIDGREEVIKLGSQIVEVRMIRKTE